MDRIDIINNVLKFLFLSFSMCFVYFKITNYRIDNKYKTIAIIIGSAIFLAFINNLALTYVSTLTIFPLVYFLYSIMLSYITKYKFSYSTLVTIISYILTYLAYTFGLLITSIVVSLLGFKPDDMYNNIFVFVLMALFTLMLLFAFLRIKKFKNGFYFLKNMNNNITETITNITIFLCGVIVIISRICKSI